MTETAKRFGKRELYRIIDKYPNDEVMSLADRWRMDWALWLVGYSHPWYVHFRLWLRRVAK